MTTETSEQIFEYNKNGKKTIPATKLVCCPFCGGAVEGHEQTYHGMAHQMTIRCKKCALNMYVTDSDPDKMVEKAIARWNNRCE